jgi:signal transduction histidine kinase
MRRTRFASRRLSPKSRATPFVTPAAGRIQFALEEEGGRNPTLSISVADNGPGIADFETAIGGTTSTGEPKLGLVTARRLMDAFEIQSAPRHGTSITLRKHVPRRAEPLTRARIDAFVRAVAAHHAGDAAVEIQQQNRDLLRSLEELRLRQEELTRLNAELEDTNRGVMALYSELDERASHLRAADETKTRFLSSVSHEFRTPVNSILALSKILLHRLDGELTTEQERQVRYIVQAADQLSDADRRPARSAQGRGRQDPAARRERSRSPTCSRRCAACSSRSW